MLEKVSLGLERVMVQQAVLERDAAAKDAFGAKGAHDWQALVTVPCFLWWGTGAIITRMGSVHEVPQETVDLEMGGLLLPEGTDVTSRDRIRQVLDGDGGVVEASPLEILSVGPFEAVTELLIRRIT